MCTGEVAPAGSHLADQIITVLPDGACPPPCLAASCSVSAHQQQFTGHGTYWLGGSCSSLSYT